MTGTISGADLALPVIKLQTRGAAAERASRETPISRREGRMNVVAIFCRVTAKRFLPSSLLFS